MLECGENNCINSKNQQCLKKDIFSGKRIQMQIQSRRAIDFIWYSLLKTSHFFNYIYRLIKLLLSIIDDYAAIEYEEFVLPMVDSIAVHFIMF